jgi:hypothetical protein
VTRHNFCVHESKIRKNKNKDEDKKYRKIAVVKNKRIGNRSIEHHRKLKKPYGLLKVSLNRKDEGRQIHAIHQLCSWTAVFGEKIPAKSRDASRSFRVSLEQAILQGVDRDRCRVVFGIAVIPFVALWLRFGVVDVAVAAADTAASSCFVLNEKS